jgi:hypothetical protein
MDRQTWEIYLLVQAIARVLGEAIEGEQAEELVRNLIATNDREIEKLGID